MTKSRMTVFAAVGLSVAGLALVGCGSGGSSASSSSAAPASSSASSQIPGGGGAAECTEAVLGDAAKQASGGSFTDVSGFYCENGWAVVAGNVNGKADAILFEAEGQFWVPKELQETCQAGGLPAKIQSMACQFVSSSS